MKHVLDIGSATKTAAVPATVLVSLSRLRLNAINEYMYILVHVITFSQTHMYSSYII